MLAAALRGSQHTQTTPHLQVLQTARSVPPSSLPSTLTCTHPTRPAPLRRLASFTEPCIELLVASTSNGNACCILPDAPANGHQYGGLSRMISLEGLNESTVAERLAAVQGHVANACDHSGAHQQQQQQPSPLVYHPQFACFLERCLEVAQMHKDLGPAPTVLLLQIVSRLNYAADESLRESFSRYYLHLQVELEAAMELHSEAISPQVALAVFEAWAALGARPMNSPPFGLALRSHIRGGRFTPQELSRLLAAMAAVRAARPSYRPSQYDVADVCARLACSVQELANPHLFSVAASLGAFPWPVYQCVVPLLHGVVEEAVRRQAVGAMSPPSSSKLLAAASSSAASLSPRLGVELEAKVAGWRAQARLATGNNVLGFGHAQSSGSEELAARF